MGEPTWTHLAGGLRWAGSGPGHTDPSAGHRRMSSQVHGQSHPKTRQRQQEWLKELMRETRPTEQLHSQRALERVQKGAGESGGHTQVPAQTDTGRGTEGLPLCQAPGPARLVEGGNALGGSKACPQRQSAVCLSALRAPVDGVHLSPDLVSWACTGDQEEAHRMSARACPAPARIPPRPTPLGSVVRAETDGDCGS